MVGRLSTCVYGQGCDWWHIWRRWSYRCLTLGQERPWRRRDHRAPRHVLPQWPLLLHHESQRARTPAKGIVPGRDHGRLRRIGNRPEGQSPERRRPRRHRDRPRLQSRLLIQRLRPAQEHTRRTNESARTIHRRHQQSRGRRLFHQYLRSAHVNKSKTTTWVAKLY